MMDHVWDEKYKIDDGQPISALTSFGILQLGMLMHKDYEFFAHRLGMDDRLPEMSTCQNTGHKLLNLWSQKGGPQATIRILRSTFANHGQLRSKLDELAWGYENLIIVYEYLNQKKEKSMPQVPRKVPIKVVLEEFFKNILSADKEVIFELEGCRDMDVLTCKDFVGKELRVLVKAVEVKENIQNLPGFFDERREKAEMRLANRETGTYVIRPHSCHVDKFVLSTTKDGSPVHLVINSSEETSTSRDKFFFFEDGHRAYSVKSLVEFYTKNNFSTHIDEVPSIKLTKHAPHDDQ